MNIIFLHGRLSNPETSHTAKAVKKYFTTLGEDVYVPDYKPNKKTEEEIESYLINYVKELGLTEDLVFIGISLGGFWALKLANRFNRVCVLLNPSTKYYGYQLLPEPNIPVTLICNEDDELLNTSETITTFQNKADVKTFCNGGHRMSNIEQVIPEIEKSVYCVSWPF